jgi:hypothetical protein
MKDLSKLGVRELDSKELKSTEGGFLVPVLIGLAFVAGVISCCKE